MLHIAAKTEDVVLFDSLMRLIDILRGPCKIDIDYLEGMRIKLRSGLLVNTVVRMWCTLGS